MGTGHDVDTTLALRQAEDGDWVRAFLAQPVKHAPGSHFLYNSGATYMLSAIIQKLSGTTLLEYLRPRLLDPIGIGPATWETCPRGINTGGWGLAVTSEDIMRFGLLYLSHGMWEGRRIIPAGWVDAASSAQISNGSNPNSDWEQGYGYQFWRCRHGAYRGDGAFGQYCVIMPEQDLVLAMTAGVTDMQAVLNIVWEQLLPALHSGALPAHASAARLHERLEALALPTPAGTPPPLAAQIAGQRYSFAANDQGLQSVTLLPGESETTLVIHDAQGQQHITCGHGAWVAGASSFGRGLPAAIAASGAWTAPDMFEGRVALTETPFIFTVTCRFDGQSLHYRAEPNVAFGPTARPWLEGQRS
jgi:CubicO group peptidase (beta-lactamase class C family)